MPGYTGHLFSVRLYGPMMRERMNTLYALMALLAIAGCAPSTPFRHDFASGYYSPDIEQCAPYARRVSGIRLYGDAYNWWDEARSRYGRGHTPIPGSILVLKKTSRMRSGHVAVVKDIISRREINVTHSNWGNSSHGRHIIYESMRVDDVSSGNDWSVVRFWNDEKNVFGFPYAAYGFVYP